MGGMEDFFSTKSMCERDQHDLDSQPPKLQIRIEGAKSPIESTYPWRDVDTQNNASQIRTLSERVDIKKRLDNGELVKIRSCAGLLTEELRRVI
jgi:hypothetical protein